jgi:hypothetical protein
MNDSEVPKGDLRAPDIALKENDRVVLRPDMRIWEFKSVPIS